MNRLEDEIRFYAVSNQLQFQPYELLEQAVARNPFIIIKETTAFSKNKGFINKNFTFDFFDSGGNVINQIQEGLWKIKKIRLFKFFGSYVSQNIEYILIDPTGRMISVKKGCSHKISSILKEIAEFREMAKFESYENYELKKEIEILKNNTT